MSFILALNSANVTGSANSTYRYNFVSGSFQAQDMEMCISTAAIPYSWFNVSQYYNNQQINLTFPTGATTTTLSFALKAGFYAISDINNAIQQQCISLGLYLKSDATNYVFFFQLLTNTTYYAIQAISYVVPTTLGTYTYASSGFYSTAGGLPSVSNQVPQMTIAAGGIGVQTGFSNGTYPATSTSATTVSSLSNLTPNGTQVNSLVLRCNLVSNSVTMPSDILDGFPINAQFGSAITYNPSFEKYVKIANGTYSSMVLTLVDQNFNAVQAQDPNIAITLLIRKKAT